MLSPHAIIERYAAIVSGNTSYKHEFAAAHDLKGNNIIYFTDLEKCEVSGMESSGPYIYYHNHPKLDITDEPMANTASPSDVWALIADNNRVGAYIHDANGNIWDVSNDYTFPDKSEEEVSKVETKLKVFIDRVRDYQRPIVHEELLKVAKEEKHLLTESEQTEFVGDTYTRIQFLIQSHALERLGLINLSYKYDESFKEWLNATEVSISTIVDVAVDHMLADPAFMARYASLRQTIGMPQLSDTLETVEECYNNLNNSQSSIIKNSNEEYKDNKDVPLKTIMRDAAMISALDNDQDKAFERGYH